MKKYGLIGYPLGHSFSKTYFSRKFQQESITGCRYLNFEMPTIDALADVLKDPELMGLNVTIPYKQAVIPFLHTTDPVVHEIGACNCIAIERGRLRGYNTDVIGFEQSLMAKWTPKDRKALILGTGGSSRAVAYVLRKMGIDFLVVSRKDPGLTDHISYDALTENNIRDHSLIINCTPLGMHPEINACPPIPYPYIGPDHYLFDLIYNPDRTLFLQKGEERGARIKNGADMLKIQAEASWDIWNGRFSLIFAGPVQED